MTVGEISIPPPRRDEATCDFRGAEGVAWEYPARDFVILPVGSGKELWMRGDWGACEFYSLLIEQGKYEALATRAVLMVPAQDERSLESVSRMHDQFRAHRRGPRKRIVLLGMATQTLAEGILRVRRDLTSERLRR